MGIALDRPSGQVELIEYVDAATIQPMALNDKEKNIRLIIVVLRFKNNYLPALYPRLEVWPRKGENNFYWKRTQSCLHSALFI